MKALQLQTEPAKSASSFWLASLLGLSPHSFRLPFGRWKPASSTPVLEPMGYGFESAGTFNPAVVKRGNKFVMLYRAQSRRGTSSLGYAESVDGVHFSRRARPVFVPEAPYERGGGCEDPRLVQFGQTCYLTYTGYNNVNGRGPAGKDAQLCLATSNDLINWRRQGVIMPAYRGKWNVGWTKSGAIVPEKVAGKYWMYYLGDARGHPGQMGLAVSDDLLHWQDALRHPVLNTRPGQFDSQVAEPGPSPVVLSDGILLIYNGADDHLVYSTGWALFDRNDPSRLLDRAKTSIFHPALRWEKVGQTPNVVFVEGMVRMASKWLFYYGGADKYVGVAEAEQV
jgi:beta-1,2-mannosidase